MLFVGIVVAALVAGFIGGCWFMKHRADVAKAAKRAVTIPSTAKIPEVVKQADAKVAAKVADVVKGS